MLSSEKRNFVQLMQIDTVGVLVTFQENQVTSLKVGGAASARGRLPLAEAHGACGHRGARAGAGPRLARASGRRYCFSKQVKETR